MVMKSVIHLIMPLTLYRKYRPQLFSEVEGQEHVVRTLQGALSTGRVGHAYLFCGPRGTGKTTIARLFAKTLNCKNLSPKTYRLKPDNIEPCNQCPSCQAVNLGNSLDLIEIDAASQTGVDNIRELNDSVRTAASGGQYKIFLIDEVHMLSKSAFNALLKTLEEPPAHALFILATTEPHKLPETILSRVQRFDFKKLAHDKIVQKLKRVAKAEKIEVEEQALFALASHAGGSLRDAESALAKLISYAGARITAEHTFEILGVVPMEVHEQFLTAIINREAAAALAKISELYESGVDLENFTRQFINYTRNQLITFIGSPQPTGLVNPQALVKIMNAFIKAKSEFKSSPVPQLPLELAVLELIDEQS